MQRPEPTDLTTQPTTRANQAVAEQNENAEENNFTMLEEMMDEIDVWRVATVNNTIVRMNSIKYRVNFNYMVQLAHLSLFWSIIDGGADTHVLGSS